MAFKKAVKSQAKLRAALFGPSGAGKTFTALKIATGIINVIGGRIALIDSERSSASKYADRFDFDQVDLENKDIDEYVFFIKEAAAAKYPVLIIDSISHAWQQLLESIDKIANAKYKGNTWSAWSEGTPEQRKLVDAITSFSGHIIVTMRSKTEWTTTTNDRGKSTPVRVGLAPEQGKGIEYEFDILFEISPEHMAHIIKDRTGKFQDKIIDKPGEEFGQQLINWLNEGVESMQSKEQRLKDALAEVGNILGSEEAGKRIFTDEEVAEVRTRSKTELAKIPKDQVDNKINFVNGLSEELLKKLHERLEAADKEKQTSPQTETVPAETEAQQTEAKTAEEPIDDGFVDDISESTPRGKKDKNAEPELALGARHE